MNQFPQSKDNMLAMASKNLALKNMTTQINKMSEEDQPHPEPCQKDWHVSFSGVYYSAG